MNDELVLKSVCGNQYSVIALGAGRNFKVKKKKEKGKKKEKKRKEEEEEKRFKMFSSKY